MKMRKIMVVKRTKQAVEEALERRRVLSMWPAHQVCRGYLECFDRAQLAYDTFSADVINVNQNVQLTQAPHYQDRSSILCILGAHWNSRLLLEKLPRFP
jgi:hypothetical protein